MNLRIRLLMINYRFKKGVNEEFSKTLRGRVNNYFKLNKVNPKANSVMIGKTLLSFGIYMTIYFSIVFGDFHNLILLFFLWIVLGLGQAVIGMTIMHDLVHGAYTKNKYIYFLLQIPVILIGVESLIWKIEHNVLHHNFTNIEGIDQDIHPRFVFRFSENQPKKWFHKYQHLYATFIYGLMIIEWVTVKDFMKVIKYRKEGLIKTNKEAIYTTVSILLKKGIFYFVFLIIPLMYMDLPPITIISMFVTMLVVSGVVLTIIFQLAHVVPACEFIKQDDETFKKNWHIHQMLTTSNFSIGNKFITHFVGSLNYQIEHHLFPNICHVHYPSISKIVRQTADEYEIPYHSKKTIFAAISDHYKLLKQLGA